MALVARAQGPSAYYERVLFDASLTADVYFYSSAEAQGKSELEAVRGRLPVEQALFHTPPNALRLHWRSVSGGGWQAHVDVDVWRNRVLHFTGDTLFLWCYSASPLPAASWPRLVLRDEDKNFTEPLDLAPYVASFRPGEWNRIAIPMRAFHSSPVHVLMPEKTAELVFSQGTVDDADHTLLIDDISIDDAHRALARSPLLPVQGVAATGYERHVEIAWQPIRNAGLHHYVIYRSRDGGPSTPVGIAVPGIERYEDFLGKTGVRASYRVAAVDSGFHQAAFSAPVSATTHGMTDFELLTMVQQASFRYYWQGAGAASGMARENLPGNDSIVATGASGFGIMALVVGVDRGFITREQGVERMLTITRFLERADRFHGAWAHFMDDSTGKALPVFGAYDDGADLVETSFLMEGLLTARQYFDRDTSQEQELRRRITDLWSTVDWVWFRRDAQNDALFWHWSPDYAWYIHNRLTGWNEVMITYLLAIASPTHGAPASFYYTGWAGRDYSRPHKVEGIELKVGDGVGGPLFFTDYSFMGFDPRGIHDKYTDYYDQNRNMARINLAYCERNPGKYAGYGKDDWGITAVDGPKGYNPYEPNAANNFDLDDGTLAPTGAISAMPYLPEASMSALTHFYRDRGAEMWGPFGFRDAFNQQQDWVSNIYMGLNQAPMVVMIENYRTGLIWKTFMKNPEIAPALERIGFRPDEK